MVRVLGISLAVLSFFALAQSEYDSRSAEEWRGAAREDVLAAYRIYLENHPGIYDLANPGFPAALADARSAGLAAASRADDRHGYALAMARFNRALSDGHAVIVTPGRAIDESTTRYWPGFVALWRGTELKVRTRVAENDLNGASIIACKGKPIREFLQHALTIRNFRPREAGQWWVRPGQLFYAFGELGPEQPRHCRFRLADGKEVDRELNWVAATEEDRDFYGDSLYADRVETGLTEPRPGIFLIGLQNFQPDDDGRAAFTRLYEDVEARRADLLKARAVVLDLRRNNGGSSHWSRDLAHILWGREALESRGQPIIGIDWRTSPDTIAYLREASAGFREQGRGEIADAWQTYADQMEAARERGEPLWRQHNEAHAEDSVRKPTPTDFTTPVYVINWGLCASACLDANDYFTRFDNVRLIGAPTSADSTYMEVRVADLPNGPARIVIPTKTWVGRKRAWGEIYEPDIPMTDLDWTIENFLNWIERDLDP